MAATLNNIKQTLAEEYAIQHNVMAGIYEGINEVPNDFLLSPIGQAETEGGDLVSPFNLDLFDEIDSKDPHKWPTYLASTTGEKFDLYLEYPDIAKIKKHLDSIK